MSDTKEQAARTEQEEQDAGIQFNAIAQLGKELDEWRAKVGELLVKLDLANLDIRNEIRMRMEIAQNAFLATRSRLRAARADADTNLSSLRLGLEQLMRDLSNALDAAEAVVHRGRQQQP